MSKNKSLIYLSTLLFLLLQNLLTSCSSSDQKTKYIDPNKNPTLVEQSWYKDMECVAPCWHGLEPGISSRAEALALAQMLSYIETGKELDNTLGDSMFSCKVPSDENCLGMQFENGVLSDLWLYPNYQITFEEIVTTMGPPDSFYYSRRDAERKGCSLSVLWINRQLDVGYGDRSSIFGDDLCDLIEKENGKLPKGLLISQVHYMTSSRIKEVVEIVQQPETGQNYTLWSGFAE